MRFLLPALGFALAAAGGQAGGPSAAPDAEAWLMRSYHCPGLVQDPATRRILPALPPPDATPEMIVAFLQQSHRALSVILGKECPDMTLPNGTLLAYDPATGMLAARTGVRAQVRIAGWVGRLDWDLPRLVTVTLSILEAPSAAVDQAAQKALAMPGDHAVLFDELVRTPGARAVVTLRGETRSGFPMRASNGLTVSYATGAKVADDGSFRLLTKERCAGTEMEFDAVLAPRMWLGSQQDGKPPAHR